MKKCCRNSFGPLFTNREEKLNRKGRKEHAILIGIGSYERLNSLLPITLEKAVKKLITKSTIK